MKLKFLQDGGTAPAAAPQAGGGPEEQIAQMAQEIVQQLGPEAALMLAQAIAQLAQSTTSSAPQGQPVYARKGGKLVAVGRK